MATGARSVEREDPEPAQMTLEEVAAVVDEAHRLGYRVAAHAEGLAGARNAIEAGVDTVEHGLSLHRAPELLATMAERGIVLVPTLSTFHDLAERFATDFAPRLVEQAKRQVEEAAQDARRRPRRGRDPRDGLRQRPAGRQRQRAGADGRRRARCGRGDRGRHRGLGLRARPDRRRHRSSPVSVADLLVVDGDPLDDPAILLEPDRVRLVIQAGRVVGGTRSGPADIRP